MKSSILHGLCEKRGYRFVSYEVGFGVKNTTRHMVFARFSLPKVGLLIDIEELQVVRSGSLRVRKESQTK
ncbi:hypothetical protein MKW98_008600 [Papaver atlanticum]|uniref:Uncharacterized protein n=1 Tax=Papaver atlanticum TaxID=357466 RepID=A0AAD4X966_9MAGN|nr:hypothetical protein MKW98_008600 [Papaver atlanticum]